MQSLLPDAVATACLNATKGEIKAITFPRDFAETDFLALDFYGWRDPKFERRAATSSPRTTASW